MKKALIGLIVLFFLGMGLSGCAGPASAQAQLSDKEFDQITNNNLQKNALEISTNTPDYTAAFAEKPWLYQLVKATVIMGIKWGSNDSCFVSGTGLVVRNSNGRMIILTARHVPAPSSDDNCKSFSDWSKIILAPSFITLSRGGIATFDRNRVIVKGPKDADWTFIGIKLPPGGSGTIPAWNEYTSVHFGVTPTLESLHAMVFQITFEQAGAQMGEPIDFMTQTGDGLKIKTHSSEFSSALVNVDKAIFPGSSGTAFVDDMGAVVAVGVEIAVNQDRVSEHSAVQYLTADGVDIFNKLETELAQMK